MVFAQLGIHRRIQRTAKVSKSEGVLLQNKLFGTRPRNPRNPRNPRKPRNPRNPQKWCHDPLLGTSPTRAGGQDDVSSQANSLKLGDFPSSLLNIFPNICSEMYPSLRLPLSLPWHLISSQDRPRRPCAVREVT